MVGAGLGKMLKIKRSGMESSAESVALGPLSSFICIKFPQNALY